MASFEAEKNGRPMAFTSRPPNTFTAGSTNGDSPMPYTCQTCARRKVRCDKIRPTCSSCRKSKLECLYQAPAPRKRRRKLSPEGNERLAQYEHILSQHGLLPPEPETSPYVEEVPQEPATSQFWAAELKAPKPGKLVAGEGKSRYIDGDIWENLAGDEVQHISEDEGDDVPPNQLLGQSASDPLTDAFLGSAVRNLHGYHPTHAEAMLMWRTYVDNVEPLCNLLHVPSQARIIEIGSRTPSTISKADECLMFAVYQFSIYSMTDAECSRAYNQPRDALLERFRHATRHALVNAMFLKTAEMPILQALVLYLMACRYHYDPHTYWMLTGTAMRIGQRMGLHKDGEKLGLSPFDVQMRRRLLYQLIPLEGIAGQMSGAGMFGLPDGWELCSPANVNDDQIWPGMTQKPEEQKGATDKMFCLTRAAVGTFGAKIGRPLLGTGPWGAENKADIVALISQIENEIEEKYLRYCDILDPLHFLTMGFARAAFTAMRMRMPLSKVKNGSATDADKKELFDFAQRILDTDIAAYAQPGLRKYLWFVKSFFAWGSWDSLIVLLTHLRRPGDMSPTETDTAWSKLEQIYNNHDELLAKKRALHLAVGRLALKAWDANPPSGNTSVPAFIIRLRDQHKANQEKQASRRHANADAIDPALRDPATPSDPSPTSDANAILGGLPDGIDLGIGNDFNLDAADWMFWDQLINDYEKQRE